ncbi:MAG: hypothetical protein KDD03_13005, partial [Gelidibacter sp.]|nr:hypothetical protein [Gelidibacter sp.]
QDSSELLLALERAFYDKDRLFITSVSSLTQNGLYSVYEAQNILNNIDLQENIKTTIEKLGNSEVIESNLDNVKMEFADKENTINSFGKLTVKNPYEQEFQIIQDYGGKDDVDLDTIENTRLQKHLQNEQNRTELENELALYKRLPHLTQNLTPYTQPILNTNAIKLTQDTQLISDLQVLKETPTELLQSDEALNYVRKLEKDLAKIGIDLVGLSEKGNYIEVVEPLQQFLLNPNEANTANLEAVMIDVMGIERTPQEVVLKMDSDQSLHYIETEKSEEEMFDNGYIKTGRKNIYQKIEKIPFAQLQSILLEDMTQKELSDLLETESRKMKTVKDNEKAKEIVAYKTVFNQPLTTPTEKTNSKEIEERQQLFNGNEEYLKGDFVADFNATIIEEKRKNSDNYRNFYSKFGINEKGIYIKSVDPLTISNLKTWLESGEIKNTEDIINYSLLSKNIPSLSSVEAPITFTNKETLRVVYSNNPQSLKITDEGYSMMNDNFITIENGTQPFVRTPEGVFELIETKGSTSLYTKLPLSEDTNYYNLSNIDLMDNQSIEQASSFVTQKLKEGGFVKQKNILTKEENKKITEENFDCI